MSDEELIARWDDYVKSVGSIMGEVEHMAQQMRDRIEALERERERLGREVNMARYGQPDFAWSVHKEAMADLEARLAKAVEALRLYACACDGGFCHANGNFCGGDARAVLAEIEGKKDE